MHFIKKIIREELEKVLSALNETDFYKNVYQQKVVPASTEDNIIYDYEKGRAFAENTLKADIDNLNRYNLIEYLPKSTDEEMWSFEFDTVYNTTLIIDIKKNVNLGGKAIWSMSFGQLYKGEKMPTLIKEIKGVEKLQQISVSCK